MDHRHELTDEQWARLEPLLPPRQPAIGKPNHDHRIILNGILWRLNTRVPWRDLPERYGAWQTVYSRFRRWQRAGIWDRVPRPAGRDRCRRRAGLDPASSGRHHDPRPPPRRRGQKGGGDQALGRSHGGVTTRLHLRVEGGGKPITWVLTPGQRNEASQVPALLEQGAVYRPRGRPRLRPKRVAGDKACTGRPTRGYLRRRGIGAVIPRLRTERCRGCASTGRRTASATASSARSTASSSTGRLPPATRSWPRPTMPS